MTSQSKSNFKFRNLLILTPIYPNEENTYISGMFVKKQLDYLKFYFENIYVIAPVLGCFKKLPSDKFCTDYKYDNVKVYFPRCFYIPIFYFSKFLIDNRLHVVKDLIEKEELEFDIIHSHFTWPSGHIGVKLKEIYNVPVMITIHENGEWFDKEVNMNYSLINYSWKNADALIRVNNKDVPTLKHYNQNVFSIPNGFSECLKNLDSNSCREQLNLPQDKKIIFSLGALIGRKGFNYLIDSMKIISEKRDDCICYIGGSGSLKNKLESQISNLNLEKYVKLIGFIPDEKLPLWINACDLFVLPSLSEGNPTVMFECLGCGKPFIGTNVGGVPEIINSEDYGLLCDPEKPKELAKNILSALGRNWDSNLIKEYSAQFSWENVSDQILKMYYQVLAKKCA